MYQLNEYGKKILKEWVKINSNRRKSLGRFIAEAELEADMCLDDYGEIYIILHKYETTHGIGVLLRLKSNCFTRIDY